MSWNPWNPWRLRRLLSQERKVSADLLEANTRQAGLIEDLQRYLKDADAKVVAARLNARPIIHRRTK